MKGYVSVVLDNYDKESYVLHTIENPKDLKKIFKEDIIKTSTVGSDDTFTILLEMDKKSPLFIDLKEDKISEEKLYKILSEDEFDYDDEYDEEEYEEEDDYEEYEYDVLLEDTTFGYYTEVVNHYLESNPTEDFQEVMDQMLGDDKMFEIWLEKWLDTIL